MTSIKNLTLFFVAFLLIACGGRGDSPYPRNETLYIGGFQWGEPASFNPLSDWPVTWPATGNVNLVYETLFAFNILTGELEPLLGKQYELEDSVLNVTLNDGTMWSDSTALTVDDVKYTFYLHKRYQTLHHSVWRFLDTVIVDSTRQSVSFVLDKKNLNPLTIKDMLGSVIILPKHVYLPLEDIAKAKNENLQNATNGAFENLVLADMLSETFFNGTVGSGPYTLREQSKNRIVLERVESYWGNKMRGGKAKPRFIIHPLYSGNDDYNQALELGKIDVSATYCPMVWNKKRAGVGTWEAAEPYYIPGSIPSLLISHQPRNVEPVTVDNKTYNATKDVLKDAAFRRALAASIDYEMIRKKAIQGYAPRLSPGYIISSGIEQIYFDTESADKNGAFSSDTYNDLKTRQNRVKSELAAAGYTWIEDSNNPGGRLVTPDGKVLADMKMTTPKGWSDWEIAVKVAVTGLRNIGVPVTEDYIEEDEYWSRLGLGQFDFIMKTPQADQLPSLPWSRFEKVMSSEDIDSVGVFIYANEGRYKNPVADSLLSVIPKLKKDAEVEEGYRKLNDLFMKEMPVIPLMYRPSEYYQFSTKHWDNFPTLETPYAPPSCLTVAAGVKALWQINPRK